MSKVDSAMKVLHLLDHSLPLHSGYAFRSQNIFRSQLKQGWQPVALTSPKHEANLSWTSRVAEEWVGGIRYYRTTPLSCGSSSPAAELRLMVTLAKRLSDVVRVEKPDILHPHSPVLNALPALWVGRRLGLPVVYEIRAFWEDAAVDHRTYRKDSWKYKMTKSLETWACRKSEQVVVLCKGLKDDLIKRGIPSAKLSIVSNGVNLEDFKACQPDAAYRKAWGLDGKKVIGFIGSFYRYEGLDLLLEAVSSLVMSRSGIVLLLVGGGEMENELKGRVRRLQLDGSVLMPGRIPHDRIPGVYALMDVLAYPRYASRLTELVTPLKPLEAMAMGTALVASDVGGHRELMRPDYTGLLFPAGNRSALAAALDRLLHDQNLLHRLKSQSIKWVRDRYSWDKTTSIYAEIYAQAMCKMLANHDPQVLSP